MLDFVFPIVIYIKGLQNSTLLKALSKRRRRKMLTDKYLLDDFSIKGDNVAEFEKAVQNVDANTLHIHRISNSLVVLSCKKQMQQTEENIIKAWYLPPNDPTNQGMLQSCKISISKNLNLVMKETLNQNKMLLADKEANAVYFVSTYAINTLGQRINVKAEALREQSLERDVFIAKKLAEPVNMTLIVKQFNQMGKVFAMMSESFPNIPLYNLCLIYKELDGKRMRGQMQCEKWSISHKLVKISFAFPDFARELDIQYRLNSLIPCIELSSSDIGDSSIKVRSFWKMECGAKVYDQTIIKEHRGKFDIDKFLLQIERDIIDKFTDLPRRLEELKKIDITPLGLDLCSKRGGNRNHKMIMQVYKAVFKKLNLVKAIGKKNLLQIEQEIDWSIKDEMHFTAYDLVMDIFSLTETLKEIFDKYKVSAEGRRKFREVVSTAAFLEYENMSVLSFTQQKIS